MIQEEKIEEPRVVESKRQPDESQFDLTLRPQNMSDFVGQKQIKENLHIAIEAATKRKEPLEHLLLYGTPGIGKTTLAHIIAVEMGVGIRVTSGPAIERAGDLGSILTNLNDGDILFIDEIHRLHRVVEEVLYPGMEEFVLDIIIGKGPAAKSIRLDLPKFTIIGATTRLSLLSSPLRDRFGSIFRLGFYSEKDIEKILARSARLLEIEIDEAGKKMIAACSRRTPRIANRLLRRVRDYAQVKGRGVIDCQCAQESLRLLEVDPLGLDDVDRRILRTLIEKFNGGPVGLSTLAAATCEEEDTLEEVYEPYLLRLGFMARTPRGRIATDLAVKHLKQRQCN